jgi:hypothetical protein
MVTGQYPVRRRTAVAGLVVAVGGVVMAAVGLLASPGPVRANAVAGGPAAITTHTVAPVVSLPPDSVRRPADADPAQVVRNYFAAINQHDYQRAWQLGGRNVGESYTAFVTGFASTEFDQLVIESVRGNVVTAGVIAIQSEGEQQNFQGVYTVSGAAVTKFSVHRTG